MIEYLRPATKEIKLGNKIISSFIVKSEDNNIDWDTVDSFGEEWMKFDKFSDKEIERMGDEYFDIVNDTMMNSSSVVLDMGCGTGRWTKYVSSKVKFIEAVDPSKAVVAANDLVGSINNVRISQAEVSALPFQDGAFDFVFSLGVLHHIPDTSLALKQTVAKLREGGYCLIYLYYTLDNKSLLFRSIFHLSNFLRYFICRLPSSSKKFVCDILAIIFYLPLVFFSKVCFKLFGEKILKYIPLSWYHDKSFNVIRNDSLDRFGTPLEQRFSKEDINRMMINAGLKDVVFSSKPPYWRAVGRKG